VARFVLRELLNDAPDGEEFDVSYSDYREGHSRVALSLQLLGEGFGRHPARTCCGPRPRPSISCRPDRSTIWRTCRRRRT
jgi:hypothetical protein